MGHDGHFKEESRKHLMKYLPNSQDDLPERSMKDSYDHGVIPLLTNFQLRDKYIATSGHVRLGRLMEDMDLFAGIKRFKMIIYLFKATFSNCNFFF